MTPKKVGEVWVAVLEDQDYIVEKLFVTTSLQVAKNNAEEYLGAPGIKWRAVGDNYFCTTDTDNACYISKEDVLD